eukprot:m.207803 g.207803  ORF g.207803 m.207803 type:complete len:368 (-) comp25404_c0_seq3:575-1678(-)
MVELRATSSSPITVTITISSVSTTISIVTLSASISSIAIPPTITITVTIPVVVSPTARLFSIASPAAIATVASVSAPITVVVTLATPATTIAGRISVPVAASLPTLPRTIAVPLGYPGLRGGCAVIKHHAVFLGSWRSGFRRCHSLALVFAAIPFRDLPFRFFNRLTKVDLDPTVVNQHVVHLEVSFFGRLGFFEFDKAVLQRLFCLPVGNDVARCDLSEPREDDLEIFGGCDRVELADKEDVLSRSCVGVGNVTHHLKDGGLRLPKLPPVQLLDLFFCHPFVVIERRIIRDPNSLELLGGWFRGGLGNEPIQTFWVLEWIIENDGVPDADILVRPAVVVHKRLPELLQDVKALLRNFSKDRVPSIK